VTRPGLGKRPSAQTPVPSTVGLLFDPTWSGRLWLTFVIPVAWALVGFYYILSTPANVRSHDFFGHVQYTSVIGEQHRIPNFNEGWETFQPPLYYLVNSLVPFQGHDHVFLVRLLSLFYGACGLWLITLTLAAHPLDFRLSALISGFIASTPTYFFLFTTYDNDSLAMFLSMALIICAYQALHSPRPWPWVTLTAILSGASLLTKYSSAPVLAYAATYSVGLAAMKMVSRKRAAILVLALGLGAACLVPWLYLHSYKQAGSPWATNFPWSDPVLVVASPLKALGLPPIQQFALRPRAAAHEYVWLFAFYSSIFGEYDFSLSAAFLWLVLAVHLVVDTMAVVAGFRTRRSRWVSLALLGAALIPLPLFIRHPQYLVADYRYRAWTWVIWALAYRNLLVNPGIFRVPARWCLAFGIALHFVWLYYHSIH